MLETSSTPTPIPSSVNSQSALFLGGLQVRAEEKEEGKALRNRSQIILAKLNNMPSNNNNDNTQERFEDSRQFMKKYKNKLVFTKVAEILGERTILC